MSNGHSRPALARTRMVLFPGSEARPPRSSGCNISSHPDRMGDGFGSKTKVCESASLLLARAMTHHHRSIFNCMNGRRSRRRRNFDSQRWFLIFLKQGGRVRTLRNNGNGKPCVAARAAKTVSNTNTVRFLLHAKLFRASPKAISMRCFFAVWSAKLQVGRLNVSKFKQE